MPINYGTNNQVSFADEHERYFALGFLASGKRTSIHWEHNDQQGAWGKEGRIHCYKDLNLFPKGLQSFSAGKPGILKRINCNDYIGELVTVHGFRLGKTTQNVGAIRLTVPSTYQTDFDRGTLV